jgi:hypothetical protein
VHVHSFRGGLSKDRCSPGRGMFSQRNTMDDIELSNSANCETDTVNLTGHLREVHLLYLKTDTKLILEGSYFIVKLGKLIVRNAIKEYAKHLRQKCQTRTMSWVRF